VVSSSREHPAPMMISSIISNLMEISILMVGDILAIFPSSKVSGEGIGLLNQSICPDGIKYLVSIAYMGCWLRGIKASYERKSALWWSASHGQSGVVKSLRISSSQ
jgi:hypothetical protein